MARMSHDIPTEIENWVSATVQAVGCPADVTADAVRALVLDFLVRMDEENARFPKRVGLPSSHLWMIDGDDFDNVYFWVLVCLPDYLEFFCGTGNSYRVQGFREPDDRTELYEVMRAEFHVPETALRINRAQAEAWLGRSW